MVEFKTPFKNLVPPMKTEEYESLKDSIATNGYWENKKIEVTEDYEVLVGHNRLRACRELGIEVPYVVNEEHKTLDEKRKYVVQENAIGRHWNNFQIVEAICKVSDVGQSARKLSLLSGVSKSTCYEATVILKHGTEEEKKNVRYGKSAIHPLYLKIKKRINAAYNDESKEDKPPKPHKKKIGEGLASGITKCPHCDKDIVISEKEEQSEKLSISDEIEDILQWIDAKSCPEISNDNKGKLLAIKDCIIKWCGN